VVGFLFRRTTGETLLSIIVLGVLVVLDSILVDVHSVNWSGVQVLIDYYRDIQRILSQHNDSVRELLVFVGSLAGLLLGLYFTAISVVVSSRFVSISPGMREHFLREPGGRQYLRLLAITAVWSLVLLAYNIVGGDIGVLSLISVLLLGLFGIAAFLYLSVRAFYLLDPTLLSDTILAELIKLAKLATSNGRLWNNESFQRHYRQRAVSELSSLESMLELASRESHLTRDSLRLLLAKCGLFLREYLKLRTQIPSQSHWYRRMPQHDNYFLADDAQLTMAIEAGGFIQPKEVPESHWLEKDIFGAMARSLSLLPADRRLNVSYNTFVSLQDYLEALGNALEVLKGKTLIDDITKPSLEQMEVEPQKSGKVREIHLAAFDASRLCYLSLVLGCLKYISDFKLEHFIDRIRQINWLSDHDIYEQNIPPGVLTELESLKKELAFESVAEGGIVSPTWYITQLAVKSILDHALDSLNYCLTILDDVFVSTAAELVREQKYTLCTFHCQRGLELCSKLEAHLRNAQNMWTKAEECRIEKEIPWVQPDWDKMRLRITNGRKSIINAFAKCLPSLAVGTRDKSFPDLFGQVYNVVCWECYQSLLGNENERFAGLFPILAISAITASQQLRDELNGWLPESQIAVSGDPILDLVDISGYALGYAELYDNNELWVRCQATWATLLSAYTDKKQILEYIVSLYEYRHGDLHISPRQTIRTRWKLAFDNKLRQLGLLSERYHSPFLNGEDESQKHKSLVIRILTRGGYEPLIPVSELFLVKYLLKLPEANGIEFSDRHNLSTLLNGADNSSSTK